MFQVSLLSHLSELAFDDECRLAVSILNQARWVTVENLEDGYQVSITLCFDDIDSCYVATQCLDGLVFTPTIKDVLTKYMDGMMSVLLGF